LALAVFLVVGLLRPSAPPTRTVVVAAHSIAAGHVIAAGDVRLSAVAAAITPTSALRDPAAVLGKTAAGAIDADEVITPSRLIGAGLLTGTSQLVEAPVRLADAASASLLVPGQLVNVLAASDTDAWTVAAYVRVLAIPGVPSGSSSGVFATSSSSDEAAGGLIVLGVDAKTAVALAKASVRSRLSVTVLAGP
jgi:pilus assembly protein CpaB